MKDKQEKQGSGNNHAGITIIRWIISFTVMFCNTEETFNERYRERSVQVLYPPHQLQTWFGKFLFLTVFLGFHRRPAWAVCCFLPSFTPPRWKTEENSALHKSVMMKLFLQGGSSDVTSSAETSPTGRSLLVVQQISNAADCVCVRPVPCPWCFTASLPENTSSCQSLSARWIFTSLF